VIRLTYFWGPSASIRQITEFHSGPIRAKVIHWIVSRPERIHMAIAIGAMVDAAIVMIFLALLVITVSFLPICRMGAPRWYLAAAGDSELPWRRVRVGRHRHGQPVDS
jgi:hypothetical protein